MPEVAVNFKRQVRTKATFHCTACPFIKRDSHHGSKKMIVSWSKLCTVEVDFHDVIYSQIFIMRAMRKNSRTRDSRPRMTEPENDRDREGPRPRNTETENDRDREYRDRDSRVNLGFGACLFGVIR